MRVLVVRPQPGAAATARRLEALGHAPLVMPLLETRPCDWAAPASPPDAVLITSAAAVAHAGPAADPFKTLPALCVGEATAAAARAAGWARAEAGPGTVQALMDGLAGRFARLLHLAGEDRTAFTPPPGLVIGIATVYRALLCPLPELPKAEAVLLHSPRTARHFAAEWDRLGGNRAAVALFAISLPTLAAAGDGWASAAAAPQPDEASLLAMLGKAG